MKNFAIALLFGMVCLSLYVNVRQDERYHKLQNDYKGLEGDYKTAQDMMNDNVPCEEQAKKQYLDCDPEGHCTLKHQDDVQQQDDDDDQDNDVGDVLTQHQI